MDIIWPLMSFGKSLIEEPASVNSPTAGPQKHGDEGWKIQQPQRLLKVKLDQPKKWDYDL